MRGAILPNKKRRGELIASTVDLHQRGMDGEIVTPLGLGMGYIMIEEAAKVKRLPRNNLRADLSGSLLNNMERAHPLFVSIEACDVEV